MSSQRFRLPPVPRWVQDQQRRGHRGGRILPHRSIWRLHLPAGRLGGSLMLAVAFTLLLLAVRPQLAGLWAQVLQVWWHALPLQGALTLPSAAAAGGLGLLDLPTPVLDWTAPRPAPATLGIHAAVLLLLWWWSGRWSDAARPGAYLLRMALIIHAASIAWFASAAPFAHSVQEHVNSGLRHLWVLMLLTPWVHLLAYYLFPVGWQHRIALTLLTWAYLAVLAPLLMVVHLVVLQTGGLLFMAMLHLLGGVAVATVGLVALYGWAMGWAAAAEHLPEASA